MENIINKLSEIESSAAAIIENAQTQKKEAAEAFKELIHTFDEELKLETEGHLKDLRERMENKVQLQLLEQKQNAQTTLEALETLYQNHHKEYAHQLFKSIIER